MRHLHPCVLSTVALSVLALAAPARAQTAAGDQAVGTTVPVLVTATRTALPEDEILAPVIVISRAELERAPAADAADLLRFHAGLEIARPGGPGQPASLLLRGTESNHTLVLVDGVRINPGTIGFAPLQNLSPELIERIEVVKGPRSALYGSDAIGGVVNVVTRAGTAERLSLQAGGGRYGTRQASLGAATGGESGQLSFGASWQDSDGLPTRRGDTVDRGYRNRSFNAGARTTLGGVDLAARLWHAEGTSEYSDFFVTPVDQDYANTAMSLEARFAPRAGWQSRLQASLMRDLIRQNQPNYLGDNDFLRTRRWALDWQNDWAVGRHHAITAGALLQRERAATLAYGDDFDVGSDADLYYLQDRIEAGRQRLLLAAGLTDHSSFGTHVTWNAEYGYEFRPGTAVFAVAGTAFRAPDATDRYGYGGNPALRPERSRNYELGLRHRVGDSGHSLSVSMFQNRLDDLIQFVFTDPATYAGENRNVERARIEGLEAAWRYEGERWRAHAAVTLQDPRDESSGTRLLRRARDNYTGLLARRFGPHELALDLLVAGNRYDFGFPAERMGGYTLANLSATLAVTAATTLTLRLENLLDEDYELARGYTTMGRSLFVAARHEFR